MNTIGIGSVVFGGAAAWGKIVAFEDSLSSLNADGPGLGWAASPNTRTRWKQIPRTAGGTNFLWDVRSGSEALVNGYGARVTNSLSGGHQVVFGNWPYCVIGIWGEGFDLLVDPYTKAPEGEIAITGHLWADLALVQPGAFCVSADAGNQ